jgi:molybdopterin-guanine dinucleotide biosynthesis protein MobB
MTGIRTRVAAIVGSSGAGKSTLLAQLIGVLVSEGLTVGAIKHTHHPLNEERRGDTARFQDAGANPVLLAGTGEAVVFSDRSPLRITFSEPEELIRHVPCEVVLVEGFRESTSWPRIEITADARPTVAELRANLDRIWRLV